MIVHPRPRPDLSNLPVLPIAIRQNEIEGVGEGSQSLSITGRMCGFKRIAYRFCVMLSAHNYFFLPGTFRSWIGLLVFGLCVSKGDLEFL